MKFGTIEYSDFYREIFNKILVLQHRWETLKLSREEYLCLMRPLKRAMHKANVPPLKSTYIDLSANLALSLFDTFHEDDKVGCITVVLAATPVDLSVTDFDIKVSGIAYFVKIKIFHVKAKKTDEGCKNDKNLQVIEKPFSVRLEGQKETLSCEEWKDWHENHSRKYENFYHAYMEVLGEMYLSQYLTYKEQIMGLTVTELGLRCNYDYLYMKISQESVQGYLERAKLLRICEDETLPNFYSPTYGEKYYSLCFSLTIFSILKPLYKHFHIGNPEFVVELNTYYKNYSGEDFARSSARFPFTSALNQLCNYRKYSDLNAADLVVKELTREELVKSFYEGNYVDAQKVPFEREYNKWGIISMDTHMGFPLLFADMPKNFKDNPELDEMEVAIFKNQKNPHEMRLESFHAIFSSKFLPSPMPKDKLKKLKTATFLPILLPQYPLKKTYPLEDCLSLPVCFPKNYEFNDIPDSMFWNYYVALGEYIAETYQNKLPSVRNIIKAAYKKALIDLHVLHRPPTFEEDHKACILSALYVALQLLPLNGKLKYSMQEPTQRLLKIFCASATIVTFINFVKNILLPDSKYHNLLFLHDETGIYLYYKEYWPAYEEYCKGKALKIETTGKKFRQELYELGLIKPQYAPGGSAYVRFDYRKKHGDALEPVLNLSPAILDYHK